ncbi:MAG: ArnT family glycosyltransferase [Isosphaeraceae bacterium]
MVDRADALSGPPPGAGPRPRAGESWSESRFAAILVVLAMLELLWLGWYLFVPLPNAVVQNHTVRRGLLLLSALPEVVPGTSFRESLVGRALAELGHVENLPQRLPVVLAAALIAGAAVGLGDLVAGMLGLRRRLGWPVRLALDYGLGAATIGSLTLVMGRMGWLTPWSTRVGLGTLAVAGAVGAWLGRRRPGERDTVGGQPGSQVARPSTRIGWLVAPLILPFLTIMMLGSMLPPMDFDVLEYHLQGPKEYFLDGWIHYLPHNIYTNMPFDVEMLHLLGMEVLGDWWWGALAGQLLVALFAPAAAVLIGATAARVSPRAGWIAALVYLSTPWVYRTAVIAYVEGPLCFYQAALVWAAVVVVNDPGRRLPPRHLLMGLLAGAAMGCKYTALLSAAIPFGLLALVESWRRRGVGPAVAFVLGWGIVLGPWLAKNVVDTGDPVYPLGYRIFHGRDWDEAMQAKWQRVHGPRPISAGEFAGSVVDVAGRSDWQSPLYLALAPLAFLAADRRRLAAVLGILAAYLFLSWWLATHRLDRFWLPILPVLAVLAGLGADWCRRVAWTVLLSAVLGLSLLTCLVYDSTALAGFNEWTGDLKTLRRTVPRDLNPPLAALDARLPADARVLLVGQASVFHLRHRMLYNTVFNRERIEELSRDRDAEGFRRELHDLGITHVYVDWHEIERYRQPGNYGYTDYVTPERFAAWVAAGVLDRPLAIGTQQDLYRVR